MKTFKQDGVTYTVHMVLDRGVVYQAVYNDGYSICAYMHGKNHTRKMVTDAIYDRAVQFDCYE